MKKTPGAMSRALDAYGYGDDPAAALARMTERETETLILHERGEHAAGRLLGPDWEAMIAGFTKRRPELLRARGARQPGRLPRHAAGAAWPRRSGVAALLVRQLRRHAARALPVAASMPTTSGSSMASGPDCTRPLSPAAGTGSEPGSRSLPAIAPMRQPRWKSPSSPRRCDRWAPSSHERSCTACSTRPLPPPIRPAACRLSCPRRRTAAASSSAPARLPPPWPARSSTTGPVRWRASSSRATVTACPASASRCRGGASGAGRCRASRPRSARSTWSPG